MVRVTLTPSIRSNVKYCIFLKIHLFLNCWMYQLQSLQLHRHMMHRVLGDVSCDIDPKDKFKGQIIYFLVNASPP